MQVQSAVFKLAFPQLLFLLFGSLEANRPFRWVIVFLAFVVFLYP